MTQKPLWCLNIFTRSSHHSLLPWHWLPRAEGSGRAVDGRVEDRGCSTEHPFVIAPGGPPPVDSGPQQSTWGLQAAVPPPSMTHIRTLSVQIWGWSGEPGCDLCEVRDRDQEGSTPRSSYMPGVGWVLDRVGHSASV